MDDGAFDPHHLRHLVQGELEQYSSPAGAWWLKANACSSASNPPWTVSFWWKSSLSISLHSAASFPSRRISA